MAAETFRAPALASTHNEKVTHRWLEGKPMPFLIASLIVILVGGIFEIVPMQVIKSNVPTITSVKPYTPLELHGRDIYIREGCYLCHSQMIRPFRSETERYGEYSKAGEFVYDTPFQWGSKRTGPDLHRIGGKYPHAWHYQHMYDPQSIAPGSIMPRYPWLLENTLDTSLTSNKIRALMTLNFPYPVGYDNVAYIDVQTQALEIVEELKVSGIETSHDREIIALIAYLQRLGTDIKGESKPIFNKP
jgi:cytochrome c oxidase cbb3-type subunit I/II